MSLTATDLSRVPHFRSARHFARLLILANMLVLAVLCGAVVQALTASHDTYTDKARQTTEALARSVGQGVAADIRLIDIALLNIDREWQRLSARGASDMSLLRTLLDEQRALVSHVDALRVSDARGRVLLSAGDHDLSIGEQAFFEQARQKPDALAVSEPLQLRDGHWAVVLARARIDARGTFQGVVFAEVTPKRFADLLDQTPIGLHGAVTVRSETLRLIARFAPDDDRAVPIGSNKVSDDLRKALAAHRTQGFFVTQTAMDGIERASAYRQVGSYPLLVLVGLDTDSIYSPWRRDSAKLILLAGAVEVLVVVLSVLLWGYHYKQARQQQQLVQIAAEQSAMLDNELVGIVRLKDRVVTWHNRALSAMLGYGPDELVGRSTRAFYADDLAFERTAEAYVDLAAGRSHRTELQMARRDGGLIWVNFSGVQLPNGESLWIMVDISAVKASEADAQHLAQHDVLTGLPNRLAMRTRMAPAVKSALTGGRKLVVVYLDLDGFKPVNDNYGHEAGDRLLCEVARRIVSCVRTMDIAARVGGDEFVVVLSDVGSVADVEPVLRRMLSLIEQPVTLTGLGTVQVNVSASMGVAVFPDQAQDVDELLGLADGAMYAAKRAGKSRIEFADV